MKKRFKLKLLVITIGCMLLQSQAFPDTILGTTGGTPGDSSGIIAAINDLKTEVLQALSSPDNSVIAQLTNLDTQVTMLFDNTFKAQFDDNGAIVGTSTLDILISNQIKNFYSWYTTTAIVTTDFLTKNQAIESAVRTQLSQQTGYNTQNDMAKKTKDINTLLAQPMEVDNNNIGIATLGLNPNDKTLTPYGSVDVNSPVASNAPSVNDLIGKDGYSSSDDQNQAKLFISYLLKSIPPPKSFYIPSKNEAPLDGTVTVYLPYSSDNSSPYTAITGISTLPDSSGTSDYDRMVAFLNGNTAYYQPYKLKTRAANVTRTLYLENLFRLYHERTKDLGNSSDKSLVEMEKGEIFSALDKTYYDNLKNRSVADVNLETLRAINKLAYLLYKIHQDNERTNLILGASALQLSGQDAQDELSYIKPIGTLISNMCWQQNLSSDRQQKCSNPQMAAQPSNPAS